MHLGATGPQVPWLGTSDRPERAITMRRPLHPLAAAQGSPRTLVPLLVGSEGTLAVLSEAELALVPRPKSRGLLVPHFESLQAALDAVAVCLEQGPSAVEVLDRMLIDLAREQRSLRRHMAAIQGQPAALTRRSPAPG